VQAKELDLLRFRAPEAMNQIIRELATRYPDVTIVDTKAYFEKQSAHGILAKKHYWSMYIPTYSVMRCFPMRFMRH
jgi:hypothetical protein